jgi:hypothetical protein
VAPAGGSQGTGQNLALGGSVPISLRPKSLRDPVPMAKVPS